MRVQNTLPAEGRASIERARNADIGKIAIARGFRLDHKGDHEGPCPRCGGTDRFSISARKGVFLCRHCQPKGGGGAINFVMFLDGVDVREAVERLIGGERAETPKPALKQAIAATGDATKLWLDIWHQGRAPQRTPVATYLAKRELLTPSSDVVRYHPACPFSGKRVPAMVALVRNILTNKPQAVHRTALDLDGNKVEVVCKDGKARDRMALGPTKGGAVKFTDDAEVTKALGVGEGLETTSSLALLPVWFGSPVWSLLSADGIRDLPVLPGIETLFVAVDHDAAGIKAATTVTKRRHDAGREVLVGWSRVEGEDLNDIVRAAS